MGDATGEFTFSTAKSFLSGLRITLTNNSGVNKTDSGIGITGGSNTAIITTPSTLHQLLLTVL